MKHKTTITKDACGNTVHVYRGIEIELDTSTPNGYYGRYSFYFKTRQRFAKLAHAKQAIDALLTK